jgi:hypothetical protein
MKNPFYPMTLILIISSLLMSCGGPSDGTEIEFTTTVNVLEQGNLSVPDEYRDLPILGFYFGHDLPRGPVLRTSFAEISNWRLPAAGPEFAFCNDGDIHTRALVDNFLTSISLIGDTGNEDVSDDIDCNCDSRIESIAFNHLEVVYEGAVGPQYEGFELKGDFLCPNSVEGHHIAGDREFGGEVEASISVTLRVLPDNSALVADITLHMIEV